MRTTEEREKNERYRCCSCLFSFFHGSILVAIDKGLFTLGNNCLEFIIVQHADSVKLKQSEPSCSRSIPSCLTFHSNVQGHVKNRQFVTFDSIRGHRKRYRVPTRRDWTAQSFFLVKFARQMTKLLTGLSFRPATMLESQASVINYPRSTVVIVARLPTTIRHRSR